MCRWADACVRMWQGECIKRLKREDSVIGTLGYIHLLAKVRGWVHAMGGQCIRRALQGFTAAN